MPSEGRPWSFGQVVEEFCTQNATRGGSSDTGTKVLAARPTRTPSTSAAMAMTPEGKCPNAARRDVGLRSVSAALIVAIIPRAAKGDHARGNLTLAMWITLLVMAVAVSLEPFRIGMTLLLLNRPRPVLQLLAFLAGGFTMDRTGRDSTRSPALSPYALEIAAVTCRGRRWAM